MSLYVSESRLPRDAIICHLFRQVGASTAPGVVDLNSRPDLESNQNHSLNGPNHKEPLFCLRTCPLVHQVNPSDGQATRTRGPPRKDGPSSITRPLGPAVLGGSAHVLQNHRTSIGRCGPLWGLRKLKLRCFSEGSDVLKLNGVGSSTRSWSTLKGVRFS